MNLLDSIAKDFVFFNDKIFNSLISPPEQTVKWWFDFRKILTTTPLDSEKIRVYVQGMYGIHSILSIETTEKQAVSRSPSNSPLRMDKKASSGLLKKKSTVLRENQINYMYHNELIDLGYGKFNALPTLEEVQNEPEQLRFDNYDSDDDVVAFSAVDIGYLERQKLPNMPSKTNFVIFFSENRIYNLIQNEYKMETENLISKVKAFWHVFNQNTKVLEKNLENVILEMKGKGLELKSRNSLSTNMVEINLKNISFYFTEEYDKVKQQFEYLC